MAVSTQTRKYSKKLIMNLLLVVILGWLILFSWAMSLWVFSGFDQVFNRIHQFSSQQMGTIAEFQYPSSRGACKPAPVQTGERSPECHEILLRKLIRMTGEVSDQINEIRDGLHKKLNTVLPANNLFNNQEVWNAIQITKQVWLLIGLTTHVMFIKLTILLAALPLFALTMMAGLVDGLNQRFIRTASLGRESSYMFHRLNHYFKRGLLVLLIVWLAIPISITPALMFVPVSILLSLMVSITACRFKKYL